jgi:Spondin_N.
LCIKSVYKNNVLYNVLCLQSELIRTIIKARGLRYPNVTGKTYAVFRVDKEDHLLSFVSRIGKMTHPPT